MTKNQVNKSICLVVIWLLAASVFAADQGNDYGLVKQELMAYFNQLTEEGSFSGAALIARDGKILLQEGFGIADYETGRLNKPGTVYPIASMTKAFTVLSIMMLEERGLLNVNDPVVDYLPEFPHGDSITLHHLLRMTSGLYRFVDNPLVGQNMGKYHTPEQLLDYFMYEPLRYEAGTQWEYCNSGYFILGVIIERLSGMCYREFLKTNIFDPLKMKDSSYDPDGVDYSPKAMAVGYNDLLTDPPTVAPYLHPTVTFSAGAIYSTVKDLYLWDQALYTDQLVSQETLTRIFTPGLGNYGYGWYIDQLEVDGQMHKHIWHWGSYWGYHSHISRLVDDGITVILLLNTTSPNIANQDQLRPVVRDAVSIILKND